jgi:phosphoribosyl-dephospho-CoA transferase
MPSHCRRNDLVFVSPRAWRSLVATREDLAAEPLAAGWVDRGWPLVVRRPVPGEPDGLALGLPMPPDCGKRRFAVLLQHGDALATTPPPRLAAAIDVAPPSWRTTLARVVELAHAHDADVRVFGSLAWRTLTGLDYLGAGSDVDLLLTMPRDVARLTAELAAIEADAPMRLDGELVREDGAGVNWRELHDGAPDVLVKAMHGVDLVAADRFIAGAMA